MKKLLWLSAIIPYLGFTQSIKLRKYKRGEKFQYQLTTESYRNGQPDAKTIAVSYHTVVEDSNKLVEEIKWISKTSYSAKDTLDLDSVARHVPVYKVSLMPGGQLKLPPLTDPSMTGEITDLHTFYAAVSPALHLQNLGPNHLSFYDSVVRGNFADGKQILRGEDCIQVKQRLLTKDNDFTIIETSFLPPFNASINPYIDTIGIALFGQPNNFQMVRKGAGDKVNLLWGTEEFIIRSKLDKRTGILLEAEMTNLLNLHMRYNASPDLKTYDGEIPLTIKRVLHLQLLR